MTLSVVVVARNEAEMIVPCLRALQFADEVVVVVDSRSDDETEQLARDMHARVVVREFTNFAAFKNAAIEIATGEWTLVVDADERVSPALAREILSVTRTELDAARVTFDNYFFGKKMEWGGWQEQHIRLFRTAGGTYTGDIHETLRLPPGSKVGDLTHHMIHLSHRSVKHNLLKTMQYVDVQAMELLQQRHPPVTPRTLFAVVVREFGSRFLRRRGFRDGMPGVIESLYQPFSLFAVHVRLWELQQGSRIDDAYRRLDDGEQ
ncbi:MAG: hypothetical protein QOJ11_666 [Frankiales bacterium]|jgi:glycosyltransferase involved in cell wall biosynthesis|nr:hypothetical protein [Frankiales bacterium]